MKKDMLGLSCDKLCNSQPYKKKKSDLNLGRVQVLCQYFIRDPYSHFPKAILKIWSTPDFNFPLAKFQIWSTPDFHFHQNLERPKFEPTLKKFNLAYSRFSFFKSKIENLEYSRFYILPKENENLEYSRF